MRHFLPALRQKPTEVRRLAKTVTKLEEKFRALNSAIKLYSFAGQHFTEN